MFDLAPNGAHVTRFDLARDMAGPWTPVRLSSYLTSGRYVSAWRDFTAEQVVLDELARSLPDVDGATGEESWHLQSLHAAWLRDRLELTTRPVDRENRNQSKADADGEWTEFVRSPSNCVLAPEAETRDVPAQAEAFAGWLVRQFSSALACLVEVCGPEVVAELLHRGVGRMNARHRMFVERAEESRPGMLAGLARTCAAEVAPEVP